MGPKLHTQILEVFVYYTDIIYHQYALCNLRLVRPVSERKLVSSSGILLDVAL